MWKNYLLVALRNLKRNRSYAAINACGLALGFTTGCRKLLPTLLVFLLGAALGWPVYAQSAVKGRVIDARTMEPLSRVNVYLAETMLGSSTDEGGRFVIQGVPPGRYRLLATMVGYQPSSTAIDIESSTDTLTQGLRLSEQTQLLKSVEVVGERSKSWEKHFAQFRRLLLGESENAEKTDILNPYVVGFHVEDGMLVARASEPLEIENRGLGYRLRFALITFRYNLSNGLLLQRGAPHFEALKPQGNDEKQRWRENRKEAYRGSIEHLFWSMIHDQVWEEGFFIAHDYRRNAPHSRRPARLSQAEAGEIIQSTVRQNRYRLDFRGHLYVVYGGERRISYSDLTRSVDPDYEITLLKSGPGTLIHETGFVDATLEPIEVSGAMGKQRLADLLPRDYLWQLQTERE